MGIDRVKNSKGSYYKKSYKKISERIHISTENDKDRQRREKNLEIKEEKGEIFGIIYEYVFNNKSELELINVLNSEEKYKKYSEYFRTWIDDVYRKKQEVCNLANKKRNESETEEEIVKALTNIKKYNTFKKYIPVIISSDVSEKRTEEEHEYK